jgi:hypothetical protein
MRTPLDRQTLLRVGFVKGLSFEIMGVVKKNLHISLPNIAIKT